MTGPRGNRRRPRWVAAALAAMLFAVYAVNGREIGASDTVASVLLPVGMLRGDGVRLNRFRHIWPADGLPYYVADKGGEIVSRYPLGPSLLALPFTAPQLVLLDHHDPDWERSPTSALYWARTLGKFSAAALAALTGATLYLLLCSLDLAAVALPATIIAALGSNLWMTGSQSLWQHGPAALSLTVALALTVPPAPGRLRLLFAGGACAALIGCRPQDAILSALILLGVLRRDGRAVLWMLPLSALFGALLVAYNMAYFGRLTGGYGELLSIGSIAAHGNTNYFGDDITGAALGTLLSPSRGLFVFVPWIPLTLLSLPAVWQRLRRSTVLCTALWALPFHFFQLATLSAWWAGWSFGPRYWTDVLPLFAVLLAFALDWARTHSRVLFAALGAAGAVAVAVQAIGAFCYPSSFNALPENIDRQHERLWTWSDTELTRCLREGPHRWE